MTIEYGNGKTEYGPGVNIHLSGDEVVTAIDNWLTSRGIIIEGPRTTTVNGELIERCSIYVDPSGIVVDPTGQRCVNGRMGPCDRLCRLWGCKYIQSRRYRLLQSRDVVEATDEYLQDDCETWQRIHDESNPTGSGLLWFVGREYHSSMHQPIRRPIRATSQR